MKRAMRLASGAASVLAPLLTLCLFAQDTSKAAAFICTSRTCSPPIFQAELLAGRVDKLMAISAAGSGE